MPAQCLTPHAPQDAFDRVRHALPQTDDSGFHYVPDVIAAAEVAHAIGATELHSNNAKRSHNGRKAAKAAMRVTGGRMEGNLSKADRPSSKNSRRKAARYGKIRGGNR